MLNILLYSGFNLIAAFLTIYLFRRLDHFLKWQGIIVVISLIIDLAGRLITVFTTTQNGYIYSLLWTIEFWMFGKAIENIIPLKNYQKKYRIAILVYLLFLLLEIFFTEYTIKRYSLIFSYFIQIIQYGVVMFLFITSDIKSDKPKIWICLGLIIYFAIVPIFLSAIRTFYDWDKILASQYHSYLIISAANIRYLFFCIGIAQFIRISKKESYQLNYDK